MFLAFSSTSLVFVSRMVDSTRSNGEHFTAGFNVPVHDFGRNCIPENKGTVHQKVSILLYSGYWGLARHFHYVPEIIGAFCWCIPASAGGRPVNWIFGLVYPIYLTILLVHRSWCDEENARINIGNTETSTKK